MANETTLALINTTALLDPIREGALRYAQYNFVAPRLFHTFTGRGFLNRVNSIYRETGVTDNMTELQDLAAVAFNRETYASLTPKEIGKQFILTDRRIETDNVNVIADAAVEIGYTIGKKVEIDSLALFSGLSGGIVGATGSALTIDKIYEARAVLEARAVPGPYVTVLHSYQWLNIFKNYVSLSNAAPLDIRNEAQRGYFVATIADMSFVVSPLVPYTGVTNEVQTITVTGSPTGGTVRYGFLGTYTTALPYNETGANIQVAMRLLRTIDGANITVTGAAGGPYVFTFIGTLAGQHFSPIVSDISLVTGGTPVYTNVNTTPGAGFATGAIFNREAMALDLRRGLRIEPFRDPSLRSTELNATMVYAVGQWRSDWGVQIQSLATAPNT